MVGNFTEADKKAFRNLLRFDVVRGEHSTGVAVVEHGTENILVYKKVGAPDLLFNSNADFADNGIYEGPTNNFKAKLFIGHNRYATKGKITDENAHPFHHNSVVGAHNGTLDSVFYLEDGNKFDVDSEAIFYNLDKYDAEDTIGNIEGAYALTWYDANENKLKVIRNKERPLHFCRRKDSDVIYWASLPWMLELALSYAGINYDKVHEFDVDTLYTFDLDAVDDGKMRQEKWHVKPGVKGRPPYWKAYTYDNYGGYSGYSTKKTTPVTQTKPASNVSPFPPANSSKPSESSSQAGSSYDELTKDELVQWGAWEGKEITFRFNCVKDGMGGVPYLAAYPDNPNLNMNIRVFAHGNSSWEQWKGATHIKKFTGKVKRFVRYVNRGKKEYYLAIDLRTIKEVVDKSESKESDTSNDYETRWWEGFNSTYLTHAEWQRATQTGCDCCQQPADEDDDDLVFLSEDTFVCGECADLPVYRDYLQHTFA